ncbi:hypothetical protein SAMN04488168_11091 [Bacillus sp. 491mf]|uniref:hypothetical protein n=1 Tax=Bacillus sp. 491mf TaxID=1761755 RepID=UPI0008EDD602|nr:hypothetical protein [Bacillus sp. 491mf]SFC83893.1 hypothetical protein SAMN04488168_11091 [Bacillus sp. 491mf]
MSIESLSVISDITDNWISNPKELFRHYTVYYFIKKFEEYSKTLERREQVAK